ncbi:hypothetical protein O1611_g10270 [Lasiodiplodia mahajangana]|uniref:Uncharacterized protein n=1 Tax=Lasiodiplodia mahajangana TaxID=1108764 RepID=A0ACC2IZZ2_9PEZI|nr:hypothetical protein O1611_g10270 [Lasiodiplodia mahajangana]
MHAIHDAIEEAVHRNNGKRPGQLERLPNEIKLEVLGWVSDGRSILNLALTGPQFCAFIAMYEKTIAFNVVTWNIPAEMLDVAAVNHSTCYATWNVHTFGHPEFNKGLRMSLAYSQSINVFVDKYRQGVYTFEKKHPKGLQLYEASQYLDTHNAVRYYAKTLAVIAEEQFPSYLPAHPEISPIALRRYQRALYIVQLVADLFSWKAALPTLAMGRAWSIFWHHFMPWEYEQVYCANKLLQQHLNNA